MHSLGSVLFLVRKLEALKMSAPNFSTLDATGVSFSFPFLFLGGVGGWGGFSNFILPSTGS